ncbi:uncharacterized protein LOC100840509 isoform X1 [Brachypodium distachyon]|uniref:DUF1618 domain-containing protein n=1 Tax=Brachypodium distachyon TaxID=15368 RepID=I1HBW7_BRADI|nr:uncharacterized protein LOC100840509 isoform X1 [Brachypodium distachyon]KQK02646.1 hypothetical protein BRADI_2g02830v3 [Brachypodium distachyon]|eukprot:XP_010230445.1 uncharacterized protein LOC100840509 isoform X1 [Brachypodium distachyon]
MPRPPSIVSFRPDALAPSPRPVFPEWVLLDKTGLISVDRNETTAECTTSEGQPVAVSFWLVDAPDVSSFSVDCPGIPEKDLHSHPPFIICAEGPFVLFCVVLDVPSWRSFHLFLYTASEEPSLQLLPEPADHVVEDFENQYFAILPSCGDHHRDYAVAFLEWEWQSADIAYPQYYAYVFSSKKRSWTRKKVLLNLHKSEKALFVDAHDITKQMAVGSTSLAWVDLKRGVILLSDVFDQQPVIKYIPFPASRVRIPDDDSRTPSIAVEYVCDVICCKDLIKFVEIECDECRSNGSTWKAITWSRKVSWDNWRKLYTVDVDDISIDSSYAALLPELLDKNTNQLKLKNLISLVPTLSMQDDNLLYMMSKLKFEEGTSWIIAVDMEHVAVKAVAPVSTKTSCTFPMYFPCSFPKYLNYMTPEADVADPFVLLSPLQITAPTVTAEGSCQIGGLEKPGYTKGYNLHEEKEADMLNPAIVPQVPQQKKRRKRGGKKKKKNPAEVQDVRFGLYFSFILSILTAASFAAVVAYRLISMS